MLFYLKQHGSVWNSIKLYVYFVLAQRYLYLVSIFVWKSEVEIFKSCQIFIYESIQSDRTVSFVLG